MAKVTGPLFSLDARGRIGDSLIFSKQRGTNYTKKHTIPTNPQTAAQGAQRRFIQALTKSWAALFSSYKNTWTNSPEISNYSPYHIFLKHNTRRWNDFLLPLGSYIANPTSCPQYGTFTYTTDGSSLFVTSKVLSLLPKPWLFLTFACTASHPTPSRQSFLGGSSDTSIVLGYFTTQATGPLPFDPVTNVFCVLVYSSNMFTPFTIASGP